MEKWKKWSQALGLLISAAQDSVMLWLKSVVEKHTAPSYWDIPSLQQRLVKWFTTTKIEDHWTHLTTEPLLPEVLRSTNSFAVDYLCLASISWAAACTNHNKSQSAAATDWPDDWAEQQQVQEEHQGPVPTQIPVDEDEGELYEQRGHQHEGDGEAHPDGVQGLVVHAAQHRGRDKLGAVEQGGQHDAERRPDAALVHHQHNAVLGRCARRRGALRRLYVSDVPLPLLHAYYWNKSVSQLLHSGHFSRSKMCLFFLETLRRTWPGFSPSAQLLPQKRRHLFCFIIVSPRCALPSEIGSLNLQGCHAVVKQHSCKLWTQAQLCQRTPSFLPELADVPAVTPSRSFLPGCICTLSTRRHFASNIVKFDGARWRVTGSRSLPLTLKGIVAGWRRRQ